MTVKPDNVSGEKIEQHVFKHEIDWGQVAIAAALLGVLYVAYVGYIADGDDDSEETGALS